MNAARRNRRIFAHAAPDPMVSVVTHPCGCTETISYTAWRNPGLAKSGLYRHAYTDWVTDIACTRHTPGRVYAKTEPSC